MGKLDWDAVKRLFAEARAQPEERRETWLAEARADPAVVAEVRSLIE